MAAKKKSKKGSTSKRTANKKVTRRPPKRRAARETAKKKGAAKARKTLVIKPTAKKKTIPKGKPEQTAIVDLIALESPSVQSGDLQGMSNVELADSESVGELLEEGNASEASTVMGVEQAEDEAEGEVRTHEAPKDDVPEEYQDKE